MIAFLKSRISIDKLQRKAQQQELAKALASIDPRKPRVLLLGQQGAGKTSLLAKSGETFHSPFHTPLGHGEVLETQSIDFWESANAVFIDPPGKWCFDPAFSTQWNQFLKQMRRKFRTPFSSVCLVVDLPTLTADAQRLQTWLDQWQQTLTWLTHCQRSFHLNIVVTHCDYLTGYAEYFAILDDEQQQQPLGFSVAEDALATQATSGSFSDKFKRFVSMLNRRLLNRLHYEPNHDRRLRIHDFPMQLNCLERPLEMWVRSLPKLGHVQLQHVFFCSSRQVATTVNLLSDDLTKVFPFIHKTSTPLVADDHPLFIAKMLPYLLPIPSAEPSSPAQKEKRTWQVICYPLVIVLLVCLTAYLHHNYQKNIQAIDEIQHYLANLNHQPSLLTKLTQLKQARQALSRYPLHNSRYSGFNQAYLLNQQLERQYRWYLSREFVPYLQKAMEEQITAETKTQSDNLYNSVRIYRMLSSPSARRDPAISAWFSRYWQTRYATQPEILKNLSGFLQDTLALPFTWHESTTLLTAATAALQKQPVAEMAYSELEQSHGSQLHPLQADLVVEGLDLTHAELPDLYAADRFATVYQQTIPQLAREFLQADTFVHLNTLSESELVTALRQQYLTHYLAAWHHSLSTVQFVPADNYELAAEQFNLLTNPDSPLWQIYQRALEAVRKTAPEALLGNAVVIDQASLPIKALSSAQAYLAQINQAPSSLKMAYDESALRFQSATPTDPLSQLATATSSLKDPIKGWITSLAQQDQQLLLLDARRYLNTLWQTNVMADYRNKIAKHFPVDVEAKDDIALDDFQSFFGPGGTIQTFFNQFLRPFVNMAKPYWQWKQVAGQSLPISQAALDPIVRASLIQKMFYTRDIHAPSFQFSLTPLSMDADSSEFTLNIGGQMVHYLPGLAKTAVVTWPGPSGNFVTLRFNNTHANNPTVTLSGPFAWLRLVYAAKPTPSQDLKQFHVTFSANSCSAEYQLVNSSALNPFAPDVLTSFRLPEELK